LKEILLNEIYRPTNIDDLILPDRLKNRFKSFIETKSMTNLIFVGSSGVGKTTTAKILVNEFGGEYLFINAALNSNIDTLRNEVQNFATSSSFDNNRKWVIFDEAQYLNVAVQPALLAFIEEVSSACGFILCCNNIQRLIPHLQSRLTIIDFSLLKEEKKDVFIQQYNRVNKILTTEGIEFDKKVVGEVLKKNFPDLRKTLNLIQTYASAGINTASGILSDVNKDLSDIVPILKEKSFNSIRKWASENSDIQDIYTKLYSILLPTMEDKNKSDFVIITNDYVYKSNFAIDPEIALTAYLCECMISVEFK